MGPSDRIASSRHGPPTKRVILLSTDEQQELARLVRAGKTEHRLVRRARVVLLRAEGVPVSVIGEQLGMHHETVLLWCDRFMKERLTGLRDRPRSGRPRSLSLESSASL